MEERMVEAAAGTSGYAAWEALRGGFYAYATALPPACSALCSGIASTRTMRQWWLRDSVELSLKLLIAGMKDLEGK